MIGVGERPLEPDREHMQELGEQVLAFVVSHIDGLGEAAASEYDGVDALLERARRPPPENPGELAPLLDMVEAGAGKGLNFPGPGYLSYIPSGGLYSSVLAVFVAAAINRYVTVPRGSPVLATLEASITRWLCEVFDLPAQAEGILTSGGSMANFSALVAARVAKLGEQFLDGVLYASDQMHHSVFKAAALAGFPAENFRVIPVTADYRLNLGRLEKRIAEDRSAGLRPAILVANAGSTDTGVIDPLGKLADLAAAENLWLHIDAAYGGFFQLTERGREKLAGIERADSITLDPHKGLFVPLGTGALIVRDGETLRRSHGIGGSYLNDVSETYGIPHSAELSPELSRSFRGLHVWLPLHLHGVSAFRKTLDEKLDLTLEVYEALGAIENLELLGPPDLTVVAFRFAERPGRDADACTRRLQAMVNDRRRVALSSTVIDGKFTLRVCILSHRTHAAQIDKALEDIRECIRAIESGR